MAKARKKARKRAINVPIESLTQDKLETFPGVLVKYFNKWKKMKIWGVDLSDVEFVLQRRSNSTSTGLATSHPLQIIVRAGTSKADSLSTTLHEIIHIVCFKLGTDDGHGAEWQALFLKAASRILRKKIEVKNTNNGYFDVHSAITKAFKEKFDL